MLAAPAASRWLLRLFRQHAAKLRKPRVRPPVLAPRVLLNPHSLTSDCNIFAVPDGVDPRDAAVVALQGLYCVNLLHLQ